MARAFAEVVRAGKIRSSDESPSSSRAEVYKVFFASRMWLFRTSTELVPRNKPPRTERAQLLLFTRYPQGGPEHTRQQASSIQLHIKAVIREYTPIEWGSVLQSRREVQNTPVRRS